MKIFKKIFFTLISLALLFVIIAYFLPSRVHIERSTTIDAPARVIYSQINDLHCWDKWSVWNQIDPDMKITYLNGGVGANSGYSWESKNKQVGNGALTITSSTPYDSITIQIDFMENGVANSYFRFTEQKPKTNVSWGFSTDLGMNPIARWMGLMINSMIGSDFENGLKNLKTVSEIIVQEKRPVVELVTLPDFNYVSMRSEVNRKDLSVEMGKTYGLLSNFINYNELLMTDMPFALYHKIDNGIIDLEAGIPVDKITQSRGSILAGTMHSRTYAHADHIGSYETISNTHEFIQKWLKQRNILVNGSPMEKYYTDPKSEPDTAKWITSIYYPILTSSN